MTDAEFMKRLRKAESLTQRALAKRLGCCATTIYQVECGRNLISRKMQEALKREFPQHFQQAEQPSISAWNPATIAFAVRVLTECGWMEKHDKALTLDFTSRAQKPASPEPWVYMSDRSPETPGRYFVAGYKRNGLPYKGIALLYADGNWYTTNGNPMPPPDKWQELRNYTETARY